MNAQKLLASTLVLGLGFLAGCSTEAPPKQISFKQQVAPILKKACAECHTAPKSEGYQKSGLAVTSYEELMKGTLHGTVVVPGQSLNSSLNRLAEGRPGVDPSIQMPHGKVKLPEAELAMLRQWVDQGAKNN